MFLFPDADRGRTPAVFRALSLRALYVDWKSRGQANYFPNFAWEWWRRWRDVREGGWIVSKQDLSALRGFQVDFLVVRSEHAIPGVEPEFSNSRFHVYQVR